MDTKNITVSTPKPYCRQWMTLFLLNKGTGTNACYGVMRPAGRRRTDKNHYGDRVGIVAKCVTSARPYAMMDLTLRRS